MLNHVHHFRLGFRNVSFCDSEIQVVFFPSPKSGGSQSWWSSRPGWNLESWVLRRCLKNPPPKKMCFTGAHNVSMFCGICGHIVFISKFACVNLHAFCCIMPIRKRWIHFMSDFMFEVWAHSCVSKKKLETALQVRDSGSIQIRPGSIHGWFPAGPHGHGHRGGCGHGLLHRTSIRDSTSTLNSPT